MSGTELRERLDLALRLAEAARAEILPRFRACTVRTKPDGTEVTDADLAAEQSMRAILTQVCPHEAILGEEFGGFDALGAERCWILDPIDGTQAFALGLPTFGVLIAYVERGEPLLGMMSFPALDYDIFAARGLGCVMRRHGTNSTSELRTSQTTDLASANVAATGLAGSSTIVEAGLNLANIVKTARRFRFVGDCVQHGLVCTGRLDAAIDLVAAPWDVAAVIVCIEEAGGTVSDAKGGRSGLLEAGSLVSAATPALASALVSALSAAQAQLDGSKKSDGEV